MVEVVANFKYMGQTLDQMDDDCPAVRQNIMLVRLVCGRLGKIPRWEGEDPSVSEIFYREMAQAVLFFGSEAWVLFESMERKVEGAHTGFLRQIMGKRVRRIVSSTWKTPRSEVVQEAAVMQLVMTYIGRQQATVEKWVVLRPISEVYVGEKGYEGGGCRREAWWRQEAEEKKLMAALAEILRESSSRRRQGERAT